MPVYPGLSISGCPPSRAYFGVGSAAGGTVTVSRFDGIGISTLCHPRKSSDFVI